MHFYITIKKDKASSDDIAQVFEAAIQYGAVLLGDGGDHLVYRFNDNNEQRGDQFAAALDDLGLEHQTVPGDEIDESMIVLAAMELPISPRKIYRGERHSADRAIIDVEPIKGNGEWGKTVPPTYRMSHYVKHSPTGMEWGYGGSGPSDCALSILADYFSCKGTAHPGPSAIESASRLYQQFKFAVVFHLPAKWTLDTQFIRQVLEWICTGQIKQRMPRITSTLANQYNEKERKAYLKRQCA